MEKYLELFQQAFVNKTISGDTLEQEVESLNYQQKVFFDALCQKAFRSDSFDNIYSVTREEDRLFGFDINSEKTKREAERVEPLTDKEKKEALSWESFPHKHDGNDYWNYHNSRDELGKDIRRPLAVKVEVSAINKEDADKIWDVVAPYLFEHEDKICFKVPTEWAFEKNQTGIEKGNFITIYTTSDEHAVEIMKDLNEILEKANLDVEKYTDNYYVNVGNSGILSAVIDRDPSGVYVPRQTGYTVGRPDRPDLFSRMKGIIEKEGLVYGEAQKEIERKEKELHFGKYIDERPKFTEDKMYKWTDLNCDSGITYLLGHYNCSNEDIKTILGNDDFSYDSTAMTSYLTLNYSYEELYEMTKETPYFEMVADEYCVSRNDYKEEKEFLCDKIADLCEIGKFDDARYILSVLCVEPRTPENYTEAFADYLKSSIHYNHLEGVHKLLSDTFSHLSNETIKRMCQSIENYEYSGYKFEFPSDEFLNLKRDSDEKILKLFYEKEYITDKQIEEYLKTDIPDERKNKIMKICEEVQQIKNEPSFEIFKQAFKDKTLSGNELEDAVNELNYEQRMYFNALCIKAFVYDINSKAFDNVYEFTKNEYLQTKLKESKAEMKEFDEKIMRAIRNPLTQQEKERALNWRTFPSSTQDSNWRGHNQREDLSPDMTRPLAIKLQITAVQEEHADKIWNVVAPYLFEHEKDIAFKVPTPEAFKKNANTSEVGNFITIYTVSDEQAIKIAYDLNNLLERANLNIDSPSFIWNVDIGNSGLIGATIDRENDKGYIPRITNEYKLGRNERGDIFEHLTKILKENNLIYGRSADIVEQKEKALNIGKYTVNKPNFTKSDIDDILKYPCKDTLCYTLNHYNCSLNDLRTIFNTPEIIGDTSSMSACLTENFSTKEIIDTAIGTNYFGRVLDAVLSKDRYMSEKEYLCEQIQAICENDSINSASKILRQCGRFDISGYDDAIATFTEFCIQNQQYDELDMLTSSRLIPNETKELIQNICDEMNKENIEHNEQEEDEETL